MTEWLFLALPVTRSTPSRLARAWGVAANTVNFHSKSLGATQGRKIDMEHTPRHNVFIDDYEARLRAYGEPELAQGFRDLRERYQ